MRLLDVKLLALKKRTSSAGTERAIAMTAHLSGSHHLAVDVFSLIGLDVSRSAAAVGYFSRHESKGGVVV